VHAAQPRRVRFCKSRNRDHTSSESIDFSSFRTLFELVRVDVNSSGEAYH
jgi:hypothetical protein